MRIEEYILACIFLSLITSGHIVGISINVISGIKDWRKRQFEKKLAEYWIIKDFHS